MWRHSGPTKFWIFMLVPTTSMIILEAFSPAFQALRRAAIQSVPLRLRLASPEECLGQLRIRQARQDSKDQGRHEGARRIERRGNHRRGASRTGGVSLCDDLQLRFGIFETTDANFFPPIRFVRRYWFSRCARRWCQSWWQKISHCCSACCRTYSLAFSTPGRRWKAWRNICAMFAGRCTWCAAKATSKAPNGWTR